MTKSLLTFSADDVPELSGGASAGGGAVDEGLFESLLWQESGGKQLKRDGTPVTSKKGAIGIAQVMPDTAPEAARLAGLEFDDIKYRSDAEYNKALGKAYFNKQMADFGEAAKALAAYNAGPGALRRALAVAKEAGQPNAWLRYLPAETQAYVPAILKKAGAGGVARPDGGPVAAAAADGSGNYYEKDRTKYATLPPPVPPRTMFEAAADAAISLGSGVVSGAGMMAAAAGADNQVAQGLDEAAKQIESFESPQRKAQKAARAETIRQAEDTGSTWEEIKAYAGSFAEAPVETILNAVGTSAPTLLMSFIPGLGQANAARLIAQGAVGAAQGAGSVKGSIYDSVQQKLVESGVDPDTAKKVAAGAQAYDGVNNGQIALGAILGVVAGTSGAEASASRIASGMGSKEAGRGVAARIAVGAGAESAPEFSQEFQERTASNIALQKEGFEVPTFQGAVGQGVLAGLASAPMGGGFAAMERTHIVPPELQPVADKAAEPNSPLSKAAVAGNTGPAAEAARAGAQQQADQEKAAAAEAAKDPFVAQVAQLEATIRQQGAMDALRSADSPSNPKEIIKDLATAKSKSARPEIREQAIARLQYALEWVGVNPAAPVASGIEQIVGDAPVGGAAQRTPTAPDTPTLRAGADRDADLQARLAAAGTEFEREQIRAQAGVNRQSKMGAPAPATAAANQAPGADQIQPGEQERLEAAALAGKVAERKKEDGPRQVVIDRALRNVEERGGVASPQEAQIFQEAGVGKPYDRIDESLAPAPELDVGRHLAAIAATAPAPAAGGIIVETGSRRDPNRLEKVQNSVEFNPAPAIQAPTVAGAKAPAQPGIDTNGTPLGRATPKDRVPTDTSGLSLAPIPSKADEASDRRMAELAAERQAREQERDSAVPRAATAPKVDSVIAALKVAPALRTAEQTAVVKQATARMTAEQMRLLTAAAQAPSTMSATDKIQLDDLRDVQRSAGRAGAADSEPRATVTAPRNVAPAAGSGPAVFRKRRATLRQIAEMGLNRVEMRGKEFFLTDGRREFKLEGAADAALARQAVRQLIDEKTARATGHAASNEQVEADNYRKGEPVTLYPGVTFIAEHARGTVRFDRKHSPPHWQQVMTHPYGDIAGTMGADGDKIDAFVPGDGDKIFVIDQVNSDGKFDEHKVILRARDEQSARQAYLSNYEPGWTGLAAITEMTPEQLRAWISKPALKPVGDISGAARSSDNGNSGGGDAAPGADSRGGVADRGVRDVGGDDGSPGDDASGVSAGGAPATAAVSSGGDRAYVTTQVDGKKVKLPVVDVPTLGNDSPRRAGGTTQITRAAAEMIQALGKAMGKDVVFFSDEGVDMGDGFVLPRVDSALFLNEHSTISQLAVFGHEFFHLLQREEPQIHAAIRQVVLERLKKDAPANYRKDYYGLKDPGNEQLNADELQELTSDLGGNLIADPKFWREVMDQLDAEHGAEAKSLIAKLAARLYAMIDALVTHFRETRQPNFKAIRGDASPYVDDLATVRAAFRDGLSKYLADRGITRPSMQAEILRAGQGPSRSTRRGFLIAAAATLANGSAKAEPALGKAKAVPESVANSKVSPEVEKILRGNGATNPAGAKALREALSMIAAKGPQELRALAADIVPMLPEKGLMLAVENADYNAHGAVEFSPGFRMRLFQGQVSQGLRHSTVLHESLHVVVAARYRTLSNAVIRENDSVMGMPAPQAAKALAQFREVWDEFRVAARTNAAFKGDDDLELSVQQAIGSPDEFFVRALTEPKLQAAMAKVEYKGKTLLERFKDWVKQGLFMWSKPEGTAPSWLDAALTASTDLMKAAAKDPADGKRMAAVDRVNSQRDSAKSDAKRSAAREKFEDDDRLGRGAGEERGADAGSGEALLDDAPGYGTPRVGAVSILGRHYSTGKRTFLSGAAFGRGLKGAERARLEGADDKRLKDRISFYIDTGKGIRPEAGVGAYAHEVRLNNIYDPRTKLIPPQKSPNAFESAVIDAGFDGYMIPDHTTTMGSAVLLGPRHQQVPVKFVGAPAAAAAPASKPAFEAEKAFDSKPADGIAEIDKIDLEKIPGARLKYGYLTVPVGSREAANAEMARIGSSMRFLTRDDNSKISNGISSEQLQDAIAGVKRTLPGAKLEVFETPAEAGIQGPPGGALPMGVTLRDGRILLFRAGLADKVEAQRTAFHELFHRGLASMLDADEYHSTMDALYASDPEVEKRAHRWGKSPEAKARQAGGMSNRDLRSLAIEEALAEMAEDVGELKLQTVNTLSAWFAKIADRLGMREMADWLRSADSAHTRAFIEKVLETFADRSFDVKLSRSRSLQREHDFEMSTRIPTAKGKNASTEDGMRDLLISDFESGRGQDKWIKSVADLVNKYPNYREADSAKTPAAHLERLIRQMADNLEWLHNQVPEATRVRSKKWYDGARVIAERMSEDYGITDAQAAGVMAVLSPQKDWFMNVSLAERVTGVLAARGKQRWTTEMSETADRIYAKAKYQEDVAAIRGKRLSDIDDQYLRAMWLRAYDEANNSRSFEIMSPEGDPLAVARAKTGQPAKVAWGGLGTIAKAISIFEDGSAANISAQLGGKHKVRNFYNNILVPNSQNGHVTIDTHAVAASLLRALSGNSIEVMHNFGGAKNAQMGLEGTYALYEEAYRRAAERLGLLPRELQSITWEAIRGMYRPTFKSQAKNVEQIDKIWNQFKKGRLSHDAARELVRDFAGGIDEPSWLGRDPGSYAEDEQAADEGDVAGDGVSDRGAADDGGARGEDSGAAAAQAAGRAGALELPEPAGVRRSASRVADEGRPDHGAREEDGSLKGLPRDFTVAGKPLRASHWQPAADVARKYMADAGLPYTPPARYVKVDKARAARIAAAYEEMPHAPQDPAVKAAYDALVAETTEQYRAVVAAGLKVEFIDFEKQGDPYAASPRLATEDVRENNHMWVFSTRDGFGSGDLDVSDNPLLAETEFEIGGQKALVNDLFRVVHDYFGHVKEGIGFRADGEENAWRAHSAMFTPLARRALTTETRGQNSWVNYGPNGEKNRTASGAETVFADQKTGLLPEWVSEDGAIEAPTIEERISAVRELIACLGK